MIYSVFDWNSGVYHYFEGGGERLGIRPKPRQNVNAPNGAGRRLEDLLPLVPSGSKPAGQGKEPRGRVAVLNVQLRGQLGEGATGSLLIDHPWLTVGLWAGAVLLSYKVAGWIGKSVAGVK